MRPALVGRVCPFVKCRAVIETRIDQLGRTVTVCPRCERRRRGLCVDCGRKAMDRCWRCSSCKKEATRRAYQVDRVRHLEKRREKDRRRWRHFTPEQRARRLARRRELRNRPGQREAANKRNAKWYRTHHIWGLAYQRRYRETHREERRRASRNWYRKLHPPKDPHCLECGAPIEWTHRGRPALRCPAHNPWRKAS